MNVLTNFQMDFPPWIVVGGRVVGTLAAGALVLLYVFQNNLLYIPRPPGFPIIPEENPDGCKSPGEWSTTGKLIGIYDGNEGDRIKFEDHIIKTIDNENIHTWLLLQPNSENVPTLIYFHGNAANMGFRLQNSAEMYARVGINILMMDYRGYGKSTGTPTEKGLEIDAEAVLTFCLSHPRLKSSPIVVFGRSLGGAVSIYLAHKFPTQVKAVIIENTFLSVAAMVDVLMPFVSAFKFLVLRIGWNSLARIPSVKQPILFIAGDSDELVPPSHMKRLYEAATASTYRDFFNVFGGQHNDTWVKAGSQYYKRMKMFLESITDPKFHQKNQVCDTTTSASASTTKTMTNEETSDFHQNRNIHKPIQSLPTMDTGFRVQ